MSIEYKQKNDVPDLYNILGLTVDVCNDSNCDEIIQKAYVKKAKICHPDKHPGRKDIAEVFELLTRAYDILKNEKDRNEYNTRLNLSKQSSSDFIQLKKTAIDNYEAIGEYKPPTDQQNLTFKEQMKAIDLKHGYDSSLEGSTITKQEAKKLMLQMSQKRNVQDNELKPMKIFEENKPFNPEKFNAAFDLVHKRDDSTIISHNGVPSAWNDMGSVINYSNFDNLDNLYVDDNSRLDISKQTFGSIDFG